MSQKHEVRTTSRHVASFSGDVPRVGEHFEYMAKWYEVTHVLWDTSMTGETVAKVIVRESHKPV